MLHELKIFREHFDPVRMGDKKFEVRRDDRSPRYEVGHDLLLREWDGGNQVYTGRKHRARITYVYRGEAVASGFCILSIKKLPDIGPRR